MKKQQTIQNNKKQNWTLIAIVVLLVSFLGFALFPIQGYAAEPIQTGITPGSLPNTAANGTAITNALDIVFGIAGGLSLLMVIIGGFRYILAGGDPQAVSQAKGTILYSIVGLLVSLAAFSIVTFVVGGLK